MATLRALTLCFAVAGCDLATGLDDLEGRASRPPGAALERLTHIRGATDVTGVAIDGDGAIYFAGAFDDTVDIGDGPVTGEAADNEIVARFSPDGAVDWSAILGAGSLRVEDMALARTGEVALVGEFTGSLRTGDASVDSDAAGDAFLCAFLDELLYVVPLSGAGAQHASHVAFRSDRREVVAGRLDEEIVLRAEPVAKLEGAGAGDVFVATFVNDTYESSRAYGDAAAQAPGALAITPAKRLFLAGMLGGAIDFGARVTQSSGGSDVFVAELTTVYEHRWSSALGDSRDDCAPTCDLVAAVAEDETVHLAGATHGALGLFTAAFAPDGAAGEARLLWSRQLGASGDARPTDAAVDPLGNVVIVGSYDRTLDLGDGTIAENDDAAPDIFVVAYDAAGAHRFSLAFPVRGSGGPPALAVGRDGHIVVAASLLGSVSIAGATLEAPEAAAFVAVLRPPS
jgi:hypothetical protein